MTGGEPGIPQEALNRGVRALRALPGYHWEIAPEQVVRVVLRAAIPALAEAVQAEYYGWPDDTAAGDAP